MRTRNSASNSGNGIDLEYRRNVTDNPDREELKKVNEGK